MNRTGLFKKKPLTASIAFAVAATLAGCGGGSGSSGSSGGSSGQQVQLSGLVAKGIIKDALVSVYGDQDGDGKYDPVPITQTSTDANGDYKVTLPQGYTGPVNIQITRGINGKMVCDITAGCKSGTTSIAFGKEMDLPQGFLLEAVDSISNDSNTEKPVSVTSLTHMAAKYAKSRGADATAVKEANEKVAKMVGVSNLTGTRPINITDSTALKSADSNARKLSVLSAALAKDAMTSDNGDITAALDDWANEFTANGGGLVANVTSLDNPETAFSLEKLLTEANAESSAITNTMIALEKEERGYDSLTPEEQAIIDAEMQSLQAELDAAIASETSSFSTALSEANEQTIGDVEEIVTEGTTVLSSAEEVKAFVDDVRTWATLLSEEQQIALANEETIFAEEANQVLNSLDASGLILSYYSQYMNLFDGFALGDIDLAMQGLGEDFDSFSNTIAALDSALVNAIDAAQAGESGTVTATLLDSQTASLSFSIDAAGKVSLTGLPITITDSTNNSLVINAASLLVDEDTTGVNKLAANFNVSFSGAKGSSFTGQLNLLGEQQEGALFGIKQDSNLGFSGQLSLKDAGTATLTANITPKGLALSNLDYSYTGADSNFSFSGAGTQIQIVNFWESITNYTYQTSSDGGATWTQTGSDKYAYDTMELQGTLKGSLNMGYAGNSLSMAIDTGVLIDDKSLGYVDLGLIALRNALITIKNTAGNTLTLTSTFDPADGSITFAHNAISHTDTTTGNSFSLTSASAKTVSEDLGYILQGLAYDYEGELAPFKAEVNGLKLTSSAKNLQGFENTYQFAGDMNVSMILQTAVETSPYEYCDNYGNCYTQYDYHTSLEPIPAGISVTGQFSNLTAGSYMKASASFSAPNGLSTINTNSLWWNILDEGLEMGKVEIAADGNSFTSTLWDSSLSTTFTNYTGTTFVPQAVVLTGSLIPGAIQFTSEPVTSTYGDNTTYKNTYTEIETTTLPCTDDSSLEACAASVTGVNGLTYTLGTERSMGELFAYGHTRLNAYTYDMPDEQRIRYQVRRAIKQTDGTYKLTGQKRERVTPNNVKFYSNMAASISFEPSLPSLPETAIVELNGNIGNLSGEGDLLMEQTDTTGNVVAQASKGLVSAILKYGNREIWLSTQLKANQETYPVEYMDWNGNLVTENYTEDFLEPVSGFIKITNAIGTSMKIVPKADDQGIVTGELRAADGGLWGTIYEAASGQLMVAYRNGAVETLTLASTGDLAQPEEISTSETDPNFCDLNPSYEGCSSTTTETAPETVTETTDTTTEVTTTTSL